jgi:hypothetical protein
MQQFACSAQEESMPLSDLPCAPAVGLASITIQQGHHALAAQQASTRILQVGPAALIASLAHLPLYLHRPALIAPLASTPEKHLPLARTVLLACLLALHNPSAQTALLENMRVHFLNQKVHALPAHLESTSILVGRQHALTAQEDSTQIEHQHQHASAAQQASTRTAPARQHVIAVQKASSLQGLLPEAAHIAQMGSSATAQVLPSAVAASLAGL